MKFRKATILIFLIFIANQCRATLPTQFEPYAKYNLDKSYYFVSVPKSKYSSKEGYTAVFDSKTNQLQFKVDKYFTGYSLFLSDNGEQLIYVYNALDTLIDSCFFIVYQKFTEPISIKAYIKKSQYMGDDFFMPNIEDILTKKGHIDVITADSTYSYHFNDQSVASSLNDTILFREGDVSFNHITENYADDSIFDISNLFVGKRSLTEQLISDFNWKPVSDKEKASKAIYFDLRIERNHQLSMLDIQVWKIPADKQFRPYPITDLKEEIIERIKTYNGLENNIPAGVDFWVYTGKMYVSD